MARLLTYESNLMIDLSADLLLHDKVYPMSLFLTSDEKQAILSSNNRQPILTDLFWALQSRVRDRALKPGLMSPDDQVDWWRVVAEYLGDAAMVYALKPSEETAVWLRDVTLSVARRSAVDWTGSSYRTLIDAPEEAGTKGYLETTHIVWGLSMVLDLAADVLTAAEQQEVKAVLTDRGMPMCLKWVEATNHMANWYCVLTSGMAVAAAVLNDEHYLAKSREHLEGCSQVFQPDGSYSESLQYGNYAGYSLMMAHEALRRRDEADSAIVPVSNYAGYARWASYSFLYNKSLTGWGPSPKARSLNFNDSGAMFKPSGEFLLHIASRAAASHPTDAGLARWLFETAYGQHVAQGPHDQASFGLVADWGALTLPLLTHAADPISPSDAKLPELADFSCGDIIARDHFGGKTVIGFHSGKDPLYGPGHLHGDLNSLILVHNDERMLVDPGHACYRNLYHGIETGTRTHNTCTFMADNTDAVLRPMEDQIGMKTLEQSKMTRRHRNGNVPDETADRGGRQLIAAQLDDLRVMGGEASKLYGNPLTHFGRFVILCGSNVVFVVDHIQASAPVKTHWHWLLNNRDDTLDYRYIGKDRIVARRGNTGMKLFHCAEGKPSTVSFACVHDAYHCLPNHRGEGRPGSGHLLTWGDTQKRTQLTALHAIAVDRYGPVADWHLKPDETGTSMVGLAGCVDWHIQLIEQNSILISERVSGREYELLLQDSTQWTLTKKN
ncbi:MAG TPA: heparinase [Phycisphaerales bacterium]|nr:heparinase [Phycisphaerales bacterium]